MTTDVLCRDCGRTNRDGARFCDGCGTRLASLCPDCGTEARPEARFCDQCGRTLAPGPVPASPPPPAPAPAPRGRASPVGYTPRHLAEKILTMRGALEGERKLVTVLFADCVGFTALSTRLDPEDLHDVMDGFFERVLDSVHRFEGTVNQFTGDGVMALFGAPIAHEDHAVRGAGAALAVQRALVDYRDDLRRGRGLELAARIGLHTGPVVVGRIGDDLRMDYTAQGETVNLAARLQSSAEPDGVLASEITHRLIGDYFDCEPRGELALKGLERPVATFAIVRRRPRRGRFDVARERGLTPLVGRERELDILAEALARAIEGRGQVVSIVGEGGVGKSRLLHELRGRAAGAEWIAADCAGHGEGLAFHAVVQILEGIFGLAEEDGPEARLAKIESAVRGLGDDLAWTLAPLARLLSLPGGDLDREGLDQAQRKHRLIDAVKAVAHRRARRGPIVLAVDDLHAIDPSSAELFESLAQSLAPHPILLVSAERPDAEVACPSLTSQLRLTIDPITPEEAHAMALSRLPAESAAPLRERIVARAEGNPLFLEELAAYVAAEPAANADALAIPTTVRDLVAARVDRLAEPLKLALQLSSVLGTEVRRSLFAALAPVDRSLEKELGELVRLGLLQESELFPEPRYRFASAITRNVTYEGMLQRTRAELHGRAGRALERLDAARLEEVAHELAHHFLQAGERGRAAAALIRAGDRAERLFAHGEARSAYRRALELGPEDAAFRREALEKLGDASFADGALVEAAEAWEGALGLAVDDRRRADLERRIGAAAWAAGEGERALAAFGRSLDVLGRDVENLEAARLYQELGRVHFRLGRHAEARSWAERALALGERLGAADVVSHAHNTIGVTLARGGDVEAGAAEVARSLESALGAQLGSVACRAYTNLAVMFSTIDPARSADYCRAGIALCERIGDALQKSWLYCALAGGHCTIAGDYDEGVEAARAAVELDERLGQRSHLPIPLILLAQIHQCRGDGEAGAVYYRRALEVAESVGEPQMLLPCYEGLATLALERGDEIEADRWLDLGRGAQERTGSSGESFVMLPFLC